MITCTALVLVILTACLIIGRRDWQREQNGYLRWNR